MVEEEAGKADTVLLVELITAALAILLGTDVVDVDTCVTTLGSVEGMGFPSLVCSFTTYHGRERNNQAEIFRSLDLLGLTFAFSDFLLITH